MKDKRRQFTFKFEGSTYAVGQDFYNKYSIIEEVDTPRGFWTNGQNYSSREETLEAIASMILDYPNKVLHEAQEEETPYSEEDYQSDLEYAQDAVKLLYKQAQEWLLEPEY